MMRGEAELRNQSFTYSAGTATGTAHILPRRPGWKQLATQQIRNSDRKRKTMSDKPKFEVIDRRKMKAEEEQENQQQPATPAEAAPATVRRRSAPGRQRVEVRGPAGARPRCNPRGWGGN
jgi:hypothetical protein